MKYKLFPGGIAPERAHFDDAGIDLKTPYPFALAPGESRLEEVDDLGESYSGRGENGYGSTGR